MPESEFIVEIAVTALLLGSIVIWVQLGIDFWHGRPVLPFHERQPPHWNPWVLVMAAAWLVFQLGTRLTTEIRELWNHPLPREPVSLETIWNNGLVIAVLGLALLMLMLKPGQMRQLARDFGLTRWRGALRVGGNGCLAAFLPFFVVQWTMVELGLRTESDQNSLLQFWQAHRGWDTALWVILLAVGLAPLVEELLYRVVIQGWLLTRVAPGWAIFASAVLFSCVHGWPDAVALLPLAFVLGYIYYRTDSYPAVVVVHMLFNSANLLLVFLSSESK